MLSPSAEMVIIDIARQNHTQHNPNAPNPEGQGRIGDGGQGQAGLVPEAPEEEGGHTLEAQLSMAQTILGHHHSWGLSPKEEGESSEQKLGSASAPADGASQEQPVGQNAMASPQAVPSAEATQQAAPQSGKLSYRHSILKAGHALSTGHNHRKVILPALTAALDLSAPPGHYDVSSNALLSTSMSQRLSRGPEVTPAAQGGSTPRDVRKRPFQDVSPTLPFSDHSKTQQTMDDHLEVQQTTTPALRSVGHDHRPPPLLIPLSHSHQSSASVTSTGRHQQHSGPSATHGSSLCSGPYLPPSPGHQEEEGGLAAAHPSQHPSPGQQSMQHEAVSFSGRTASWQHFTRRSSLGMNPFLGLFTPTGFGCQPPGGQGFDPGHTPLGASKPGLAGLRFFQVQGNQDCEGSWAVSALAEGQLQCAVTGDALEHMLQLRDPSLLEAVMRNAVVFARMKPQQKGQVMDLLGTAGLHELFDGQHHHIEVCRARLCWHALPVLLDSTLGFCPVVYVCCAVLCCACFAVLCRDSMRQYL